MEERIWTRVYTHPEINTVFSNQTWIDSLGIGWLYGGGNILLKSNDYGQTFLDYFQYFPAASNGKHYFSRLYFINENTGWASGSDIDDNNMHKTTDGGFSWIFQDNPVTQFFFTQLNDCVFLNKDTGWASSVPGIIIATTNGGEEWFVDLSAPREFWPLEVVKSQSRHFVWSGTDLNRLWKATIDKTVSISNNSTTIPQEFRLHQNYPNPFNPVTNISFSIPVEGLVKLKVFDITGREVAVLVNELKTPGSYNVSFNGSTLSSGVYFYRIEAGSFVETKRMLLVK